MKTSVKLMEGTCHLADGTVHTHVEHLVCVFRMVHSLSVQCKKGHATFLPVQYNAYSKGCKDSPELTNHLVLAKHKHFPTSAFNNSQHYQLIPCAKRWLLVASHRVFHIILKTNP